MNFLARNGLIEYNGVVFNCDYKQNAITLGDMSDKRALRNQSSLFYVKKCVNAHKYYDKMFSYTFGRKSLQIENCHCIIVNN